MFLYTIIIARNTAHNRPRPKLLRSSSQRSFTSRKTSAIGQTLFAIWAPADRNKNMIVIPGTLRGKHNFVLYIYLLSEQNG